MCSAETILQTDLQGIVPLRINGQRIAIKRRPENGLSLLMNNAPLNHILDDKASVANKQQCGMAEAVASKGRFTKEKSAMPSILRSVA